MVGSVEHRLAFGGFERVGGVEFGQLEFVLFVADGVLGQAPPLEGGWVFFLFFVFLCLLFGRLYSNIFLVFHHFVILLHNIVMHGTGPLEIKVDIFIEARKGVLNMHQRLV